MITEAIPYLPNPKDHLTRISNLNLEAKSFLDQKLLADLFELINKGGTITIRTNYQERTYTLESPPNE